MANKKKLFYNNRLSSTQTIFCFKKKKKNIIGSIPQSFTDFYLPFVLPFSAARIQFLFAHETNTRQSWEINKCRYFVVIQIGTPLPVPVQFYCLFVLLIRLGILLNQNQDEAAHSIVYARTMRWYVSHKCQFCINFYSHLIAIFEALTKI